MQDVSRPLRNLDKKETQELDLLLASLGDLEDHRVSISSDLKNRVALFCFGLIQRTRVESQAIQDTCEVVACFIFHSFGDELDDIISLAGRLELPDSLIRGDRFTLFNEMTELVKKYLSKVKMIG